ncbi:SPOR domain-containing protein [Clostridium sp. MT-14]|uniref:SPOR domain-containing protein n=1 Tax=unclassified Clostridium TaxID=2614128 RepID=UPI001238F590|nr:hypothetical protein [Clostridium sp. HV4-5-A1G]KAA8666484.1 hypothetical protein F3O63_16870 [Clostridium sp. HV4-5-A1G]CAB1239942.1 conserved hypothetical protein [Clostridiaceae bacterium BL-3]
MKYTRYDLKKDNSTKTFVIFIFIILLSAFILGTFIFQIIVKNPVNLGYTNTSQNKTESEYESNSVLKNEDVKFVAVQGGIYKDRNNVEKEKEVLSKHGIPFCITESGKTRVFLGIFSEDDADKIMKSLREQNIETSPKVFTIKQDDICDTEIIQIIDANLKILNKLSSEDVKSIQTVELKRWCSSIEKGEAGNYRNKSILKELKEYINKLPKEITKDNNDENYVYLFNELNKIGSN